MISRRNLVEMAVIVGLSLLLAVMAHALRGFPPAPSFRPAELSLDARQLPLVEADLLEQLLQEPGTLVLDARHALSYDAGHIPGARSLPLGQWRDYLPALRPLLEEAQFTIVYCIDRDCRDALLLAEVLLAEGFSGIMLYEGGIGDWRSRGLPLSGGEL